VVDLSQFDTFEEVKSQFYETMFVPYEYNGGIYGFPETMDFTCLYYRTDIFESLGLDVPRTWDDLYQTTLPVLYENNMMFAFPVDTTASSNSPTSLRGMTMFLIQNGGSFYTEDGMYSALDTSEAYLAFKSWTDLYVSYGLDAETNFFTEFRTGTTPIGVGTFSTYIQLQEAAPELYGRWEIAPMLGTLQEDGTIDRSMGGISSTSCMIMSQAEKEGHAEAAWEFLSWWMDYETQIKYGRELEATIGTSARWATANIEAFDSLPWDPDHLKIIKNQMAEANEQPIVLGGYFTTRHLVNAWNRVYMQNENPRDALEEAVKEINKEIRNKHEEYGFMYDDEE
jgi:ABC-type glycerol-3-phosphate transport system substrate-binding protein